MRIGAQRPRVSFVPAGHGAQALHLLSGARAQRDPIGARGRLQWHSDLHPQNGLMSLHFYAGLGGRHTQKHVGSRFVEIVRAKLDRHPVRRAIGGMVPSVVVA